MTQLMTMMIKNPSKRQIHSVARFYGRGFSCSVCVYGSLSTLPLPSCWSQN